MKIWINISLFLSLLVSSTLCLAEEAAAYYRYKDKDGNIVMSSTLPPEYANDGYEMLNSSGSVIETVAPRKSDAEIQKEAANLKQLEIEKQKAELQQQKDQAQQHKDEILLKSFNSQQDIERARDDKIASIKVLEEIVIENMDGLERQLSVAKNAAATYQQGGQAVPEKLQKTIDSSIRQIQDNKAFLERKEAEKKEIAEKYQALIQRFQEIQAKRPVAEGSSSSPATETESTPNSPGP